MHACRPSLWMVTVISALLLTPASSSAQMITANPYATVPGVWGQLPEGRSWGSTSAVYP